MRDGTRRQKSDDTLVEKIIEMLDNTLPIANRDIRAYIKEEIRKLLQSRQPEKPIFPGYKFESFISKKTTDSELMLELKRRGLVTMVEK